MAERPAGARSARSGAPKRLGAYRAKRDFRSSPEPDGRGGKVPRADGAAWDRLPEGRRFCVQLHRASRLHYDLRLEHRGVLLSWAVPKGPSMDPSQRRLAVQVEDHPVDYGGFEGVIPSGYGAGTVLIWDLGELSFEKGPKGGPDAGLRLGHLDFRLQGSRLRGGFSLVRMERRRDDKPQWLLLKRRDGEAAEGRELEQSSVTSGRTLDQVAQVDGTGGAELDEILQAAPSAEPPPTISPMLATLATTPFSDPGWLFELKYDGVRCLLRKEGGRVRLVGRSGRDETGRYPELSRAAQAVPLQSAVLDGEVVALDEDGRPSFGRLQRRLQLSPAAAERAADESPVSYVAFDLLFAQGRDLRRLPLERRKRALRMILGEPGGIIYADQVLERGEDLFREVRRRGLEGVMAKRRDSAYQTGRRSRDWRKLKARQTQDCVVCGYLPGRGRRQALGALWLGVYAHGELVVAGRVGSGLTESLVQALRRSLDRIRRETPPFSFAGRLPGESVWVRPELVCEVEHAGWTTAGRLRQPSFRGLRPDLPSLACIREPALPTAAAATVRAGAAASSADHSQGEDQDGVSAALGELAELPERGGRLRVGSREVAVSHPDKLLWPAAGISKRDLIAYHLKMARYLLPHLRDRAVVTRVFPDGVSGKGFWRRSVPQGAPAWLPRWEATPGTPTICPLIQEPAALVWLANLGALEIHLWHSRRQRPEQPDWAVFDLDPSAGAGFQEVVQVARFLREALGALKLRSYLKTSGQSGLHIYVPIRRGPDQDQVRAWVGQLAHLAALELPKLVTERWAVAQRQGRVRIDHTQNVVGKTLAAVYSPRPLPGAPVSTPLGWEELEHLDLASLDLRSVPERVDRLGEDLFAPVLEGGQRLPALDRVLPSSRGGS